MFDRELNRARFGLSFVPRGPVLVKSGLQTPDPTRPQLEFVRSRHAELGTTVYLPGSTLKGVLRSHGERVLKGLGFAQVCSPVSKEKGPCRDTRGPSPAAISSRQCPICRVFGSLGQAGRLQIGDAFPWPAEKGDRASLEAGLTKANATERRFQVGIDREVGSAQDSALFDLEVVVGGNFETIGHLRNFELWQLGLLAQLVADLSAGFCAVGSGKSRGLGQMAANITWLELEMAQSKERSGASEFLGLGALLDQRERREFGMVLEKAEDRVPLPAGFHLLETWRGARLNSRLAGADLAHFLRGLTDKPLATFVGRQGRHAGAGHGG